MPGRDFHAVNANEVRAELELHVVPGPNRRDHDAQFLDELSSQGLHAVEQVAVGGRIDEVDEVDGELEAERLDAEGTPQLGRRVRVVVLLVHRRELEHLLFQRLGRLPEPATEQVGTAADHEERDLGNARGNGEGHHRQTAGSDGAVLTGEL